MQNARLVTENQTANLKIKNATEIQGNRENKNCNAKLKTADVERITKSRSQNRRTNPKKPNAITD
jgi:hypothetical protein